MLSGVLSPRGHQAAETRRGHPVPPRMQPALPGVSVCSPRLAPRPPSSLSPPAQPAAAPVLPWSGEGRSRGVSPALRPFFPGAAPQPSGPSPSLPRPVPSFPVHSPFSPGCTQSHLGANLSPGGCNPSFPDRQTGLDRPSSGCSGLSSQVPTLDLLLLLTQPLMHALPVFPKCQARSGLPLLPLSSCLPPSLALSLPGSLSP